MLPIFFYGGEKSVIHNLLVHFMILQKLWYPFLQTSEFRTHYVRLFESGIFFYILDYTNPVNIPPMV